ncbi:hypothetical protein OLMES_3604 [Oleiphilus messinensis]|uniref:AmpE protein n=1 Tax=Oleiphilus messinensis TaxID=141451 RepID=A0A1Y0IAY4_9GAMM|nr:hypothetical protein [Oleiphilus messinensis]ARU57631.1 hypothetical protein OLMES_3604 [Oleiphilus messinensis]
MSILLVCSALILQRLLGLTFNQRLITEIDKVLYADAMQRKLAQEWFHVVFLLAALALFACLHILLQWTFPLAYGVFGFFLSWLLLIVLLGNPQAKIIISQFETAWQARQHYQAGLSIAKAADIQRNAKTLQGTDAKGEALVYERAFFCVLEDTYRSYFVIIFWFLMLGPVAALLVRLLERWVLCAPNRRGWAGRFLLWGLDFIPSRCLVLSLWLVGRPAGIKLRFKSLFFGWSHNTVQVFQPHFHRLLHRVGRETSVGYIQQLRAGLGWVLLFWLLFSAGFTAYKASWMG